MIASFKNMDMITHQPDPNWENNNYMGEEIMKTIGKFILALGVALPVTGASFTRGISGQTDILLQCPGRLVPIDGPGF